MSKRVLPSCSAVLLWTAVLLYGAGCVSTPTPPSPLPPTSTALPAETALPTPVTRTARTLPPEWTKTFTPTATITPTNTPTFTPTATLNREAVCTGVQNSLQLMPEVTVRNDEGLAFVAGVDASEAVLTLRFQRRGSDTPPDEAAIPGGTAFLLNVGRGYQPGIYDWTASVSTPVYTEICQQEGWLRVVSAPTSTEEPLATPEQTLLEEVLDVFRRRLGAN